MGYAMVQLGSETALLGRHVKLGLWMRLPGQQQVVFVDPSIRGPQDPSESFYCSVSQQDPTTQDIKDALDALARPRGIALPGPDEWKIGVFESVESEIIARGITRVVHFTPLGNVPSIVERGLCPRRLLELERVPFECTDRERGMRGADLLDYSCLSIGWHNYAMLWAKCGGSFKGWAMIDLRPAILTNGSCLFFPRNSSASISRYEYRNDKQGLRGLKGFRKLYAAEIDDRQRSAAISSDMPTHPQAEVMCAEVLPWECVTRCVVSCESDKQELLSKALSISDDVLVVDTACFKPRRDYNLWSKPHPGVGSNDVPGDTNDVDIPF